MSEGVMMGYKKNGRGLYEAKIKDGQLPDGRSHYVHLYSTSSRDLDRKVRDLRDRLAREDYALPTGLTFFEYAQKWMDAYKAKKSENTRAMYRNILNKHCSVIFGVPIKDLRRIHLVNLLNKIESPNIYNKTLMTLKQVMRSAAVDGLCSTSTVNNIFTGISKKNLRAKKKRALSEDEINAVFNAELSQSDQCFLMMIYGCGLRREEALALTRFDFDISTKSVNISKAVTFSDSRPVLKEPKTHNGFRRVPVPPSVWDILWPYISMRDGYLISNRHAEPMTFQGYRCMWNRILKAMSAASGKEIKLTAHYFRHNYATRLCYQIPRLSIKHIAEILGDTEAVVIKIYNHVIMENEDDQAIYDALKCDTI
jgi:integrase